MKGGLETPSGKPPKSDLCPPLGPLDPPDSATTVAEGPLGLLPARLSAATASMEANGASAASLSLEKASGQDPPMLASSEGDGRAPEPPGNFSLTSAVDGGASKTDGDGATGRASVRRDGESPLAVERQRLPPGRCVGLARLDDAGIRA